MISGFICVNRLINVFVRHVFKVYMVATICLYISVFAWNIPKNDYAEVTEDETTLVKYSIYHIALL